MPENVPHAMRAARLMAFGTPPKVELREVLVPEVGPGQVLIRLSAAAVHAADLRVARTGVGLRRPLPTTPGREGVGRVVAVGSGWVTSWLVGKRVACLATPNQAGTWAPWVVTDARRCLPLADAVRDPQAALGLHAAVAAVAALQQLDVSRRRGLVLTAPDAAVSAAMASVARARGVAVVLVARDPAEAARARARGAQVVIDGSAADADAQVRRESRAVDARVIVDAGGGNLLGRLLSALPDGAEAVLVDDDAQPVRVEAAELVARRKVIRGLSSDSAPDGPDPRGIARWRPALEARLAELVVPSDPPLRLDELPEVVSADPASLGPVGRWIDLR